MAQQVQGPTCVGRELVALLQVLVNHGLHVGGRLVRELCRGADGPSCGGGQGGGKWARGTRRLEGAGARGSSLESQRCTAEPCMHLWVGSCRPPRQWPPAAASLAPSRLAHPLPRPGRLPRLSPVWQRGGGRGSAMLDCPILT